MHSIRLLMSSNTKPVFRGEQCDCACVVSYGAVSKHLSFSGVFVAASDLQYKEIDHNHSLVFNPRLGNSIVVVSSLGRNAIESFGQPREILLGDDTESIQGLINSGLLDLTDDGTESSVKSSPQVLSAWLHITDRCNLRCDYCYLPHIREDMSPETGRGALDATFRSATANSFTQIKLKYAGGEPLLRAPLIVELHGYAQSLAEQYGLGLEGVVLSNGTLLTTEMVETLKVAGPSFNDLIRWTRPGS